MYYCTWTCTTIGHPSLPVHVDCGEQNVLGISNGEKHIINDRYYCDRDHIEMDGGNEWASGKNVNDFFFWPHLPTSHHDAVSSRVRN